MMWIKRTLLIAVVAVFAGGWWAAQADSPADVPHDGDNNTVLEITQSAGRVVVRRNPGNSAEEIETLLWGDRVLWLGEVASADNQQWYEVVLGSGTIGWMPARGFIEANSVYTTPGVRINTLVRVTADGSGSNLRLLPSTYAELIRQTQTGDEMTVIGGPYQAEFQMWWLVRYPNGDSGWLIDIPGWLVVAGNG